MTWYRQVMHVAAKDLRQARWTLAAFAAFIALSTTWAIEATASFPISFVGSLGVPLGMFVVCILVQGDSPIRADSYWATRPLSPSAVVLAKVVTVAVAVMLPGVVGQLIVYLWYGTPRDTIPSLIAQAEGVNGVLFLIAMSVAALTANVTSFLLTGLALIVADLVGGSLQGSHHPSLFLPGPAIDLANAVPIVLWVAAMVYLYRTRNATRGRQVAAAAMVATLILPTTTAIGHPAPPPPSVAPALPITVTWMGISVRDSGTSVQCRIASTDSTGALLVLSYASGYLERNDGRVESLDVQGGGLDVALNAPKLELGASVRWMRDQGGLRQSDVVTLNLTEDQAGALRRGEARLRITGDLNEERARVNWVLPLHHGANVKGNGSRFQFDQIVSVSRPLLMVNAATVGWATFATGAWGADRVAFVLVNQARQEAVRMRPVGWAEEDPILFSLPFGATLSRMTLEEQVDRPADFTAPVIDAHWMQGAQLEILDWTSVRTIPVNVVVDQTMVK